MNNSIFSLFGYSLYSLKKIAKLRAAGIGKTIKYVFLLSFVYFLPGLFDALDPDGIRSEIPETFLLPFYILFMYIFYAGLIFLKISVFAIYGTGFAHLAKRKLVYRHSWRLSAFSITLPVLLFALLAFFDITFKGDSTIDLLLSLLIISGSILTIPKRADS